MRCYSFIALAVLAVAAWMPAMAHAQEDLGVRRVGIRGGATIDPDQIHLGMHVNAGEFTENVRFQPSFDIGFGDDLLVGTFNIDALYMFEPQPWRPYLGAGLGVALIDFDEDRFPGRRDDVEVEAGLNVIAGFEWGPSHEYLLEIRGGIGDIPDLKVTVGYNF